MWSVGVILCVSGRAEGGGCFPLALLARCFGLYLYEYGDVCFYVRGMHAFRMWGYAFGACLDACSYGAGGTYFRWLIGRYCGSEVVAYKVHLSVSSNVSRERSGAYFSGLGWEKIRGGEVYQYTCQRVVGLVFWPFRVSFVSVTYIVLLYRLFYLIVRVDAWFFRVVCPAVVVRQRFFQWLRFRFQT